MERAVELAHLALGEVLDRHLERPEDGHEPGAALVQVLAEVMLEEPHVDHALHLRDADPVAEGADRLRRVAAAPEARERRHARVVPAAHELLLDELGELALRHDRVGEVQAGELDLPRREDARALQAPVVERAVRLELEGADRVRDLLDRVRERVGVVVHRVDAPLLGRAVVGGVTDPVEDRVAHVHVRRLDVDPGAEDVLPVRELARAHAPEEVEVLGDRPVAVGARLPLHVVVAAVLADLLLVQAVDVGEALLDQALGDLVELLEVVRGVVEVVPLEAEPAHVRLDRLDVLHVLGRRVRVVEAEVARPTELARDPEVEADRLGVSYVEVAVRLGREARRDAAVVLLLAHVLEGYVSDEVGLGRGLLAPVGLVAHASKLP